MGFENKAYRLAKAANTHRIKVLLFDSSTVEMINSFWTRRSALKGSRWHLHHLLCDWVWLLIIRLILNKNCCIALLFFFPTNRHDRPLKDRDWVCFLVKHQLSVVALEDWTCTRYFSVAEAPYNVKFPWPVFWNQSSHSNTGLLEVHTKTKVWKGALCDGAATSLTTESMPGSVTAWSVMLYIVRRRAYSPTLSHTYHIWHILRRELHT